MDLGLEDKVAAITGGSIGIGLAVARALAGEGVHICICARDEKRVGDAAEVIAKEQGVRTLGVRADVTSVDDIDAFVKKIARTFGGADILINNAGTGSAEKIMDAPDERWQYYWDLHVMAAIRFSRALIPFMRERGGGVILNTSSVCAKQPLDYEPIYNVTKAALTMLSKCLANEVIGDNIRVNGINPGLILTPDWRKTAGIVSKEKGMTPQEYLDGIAADMAPIRRFASPEELAHFYAFMCSDRASYCVGSSYYVDGGFIPVVL
jgi:NAD(P)-dependent dehydrogenase (short-subunit alcohol dehydrogenase family)